MPSSSAPIVGAVKFPALLGDAMAIPGRRIVPAGYLPHPSTGTNFTPRVRGGFGEPLVAGGDVYAQCHFGLGVQGCPVLTLLESTTQSLIRRASDRCPGPLPLGSPAQHEYCRDFRRLKSPLTMSSSSVASPAQEAPRQRPKCTILYCGRAGDARRESQGIGAPLLGRRLGRR